MRRSRRSWAERAAALAALALVAASCGGGQVYGGGTTRTAERERTAKGSTPTRAEKGAGMGTIVVTVIDLDGRLRTDVPVVIAGTRYATRRGVARATLPAGEHRVEVPAGCGATMEVLRGGGRSIGLPGGQTIKLRVRADVRRRYAAGTPVTWEPEAPWPLRETVAFRFSLYDRCTDRLAPGTAIRYLRFRPSASIEMVDEGTKRSDAQAFVRVGFRCVRSGDATLRLEDPDNPRDGVDLLSLRPPFDPSADWCASA